MPKVKYNIIWFSNNSIRSIHANLPIKQVYCWLYTKDKKIVIVSKDNKKWQFPGGHPNLGETNLQTLVREIWEETNINLEKKKNEAKFFGYYTIEEVNNQDQIIDKYLQIRYFLKLDINSNQLSLKTNENNPNSQTTHMRYVDVVDKNKLVSRIKWLKKTGEYSVVKKLMC